MANLGNFNASEVDPAVGFDPIPAGKYLAVATESGMKATKSGAGNFLELTLQVLEGEFKGQVAKTCVIRGVRTSVGVAGRGCQCRGQGRNQDWPERSWRAREVGSPAEIHTESGYPKDSASIPPGEGWSVQRSRFNHFLSAASR